MRHNVFDRLHKLIAIHLIEAMSTVETEREVAVPAQYIDVAYDCEAGAQPAVWTGWFGRMLAQGLGGAAGSAP